MKTPLIFITTLLTLPLFAEESPAAVRQQSMVQTFMMIGIALLFFYVILWRPEQKRRKKMQEQKSAMKIGDKITAMGIVGTLDSIEKNTVVLKSVDGSKIEVLTAAISDVSSPDSQIN